MIEHSKMLRIFSIPATYFFITIVLTLFFYHAFVQVRLSTNINTYDAVHQLSADLVAYGRTHNGFNNAEDGSVVFLDYLDGLLEYYNLEEVISPERDIIPYLKPRLGRYVQRQDEIEVTIIYTIQPLNPKEPSSTLNTYNRDTNQLEASTKGSAHIKEENSPSNYELYEEATYGEGL